MDDFKLTLLIMRNKSRLESLITKGENYEKILKQSQKLDKYISMKMKKQMKKYDCLEQEGRELVKGKFAELEND